MNRSDELGELATALSAAQGEFESVAKGATNPFFKSKYADLPTIVKAASPILTTHGLAVFQGLGHDEQGDTLTTVLLHSSGQFIGDTMRLRPVKDDPQAQGSATTYGRRYAYMAALGLVADEDDDGNAGSAGQRKPAKAKPKPAPQQAPSGNASGPNPVTLEQSTGEAVAKIRDAFNASGKTPDWLKLKLVEITGRDADNVRDAMAALTLDEALRLYADLDGKGDLLDDGIPGSGS